MGLLSVELRLPRLFTIGHRVDAARARRLGGREEPFYQPYGVWLGSERIVRLEGAGGCGCWERREAAILAEVIIDRTQFVLGLPAQPQFLFSCSLREGEGCLGSKPKVCGCVCPRARVTYSEVQTNVLAQAQAFA